MTSMASDRLTLLQTPHAVMHNVLCPLSLLLFALVGSREVKQQRAQATPTGCIHNSKTLFCAPELSSSSATIPASSGNCSQCHINQDIFFRPFLFTPASIVSRHITLSVTITLPEQHNHKYAHNPP
mmetsp:Transcript_53290/g.87601  ORF Transcript_53290/g.87601 Transcript_53290/m.87601 type:complete len:126 (+) Transcript_53290:2-379(+)